jgi:hypothetical protein
MPGGEDTLMHNDLEISVVKHDCLTKAAFHILYDNLILIEGASKLSLMFPTTLICIGAPLPLNLKIMFLKFS